MILLAVLWLTSQTPGYIAMHGSGESEKSVKFLVFASYLSKLGEYTTGVLRTISDPDLGITGE
mgnify:CR=1 FL=1